MQYILLEIAELPYKEAYKKLSELLREPVWFDLSHLEIITSWEEKQLITDFFDEYQYFSPDDLSYLERFINCNLDHANKDFVSDLIYFAMDFGLDLNYTKILSMLVIEKVDEDCLVLGCIEYISMNIKFLYLNEIIKKLEHVINHKVYRQNEQLCASMTLYRITMKNHYLDFVQELIDLDDTNLIYLNNTLKAEMYSENYFTIADFNKKVKRLHTDH